MSIEDQINNETKHFITEYVNQEILNISKEKNGTKNSISISGHTHKHELHAVNARAHTNTHTTYTTYI